MSYPLLAPPYRVAPTPSLPRAFLSCCLFFEKPRLAHLLSQEPAPDPKETAEPGVSTPETAAAPEEAEPAEAEVSAEPVATNCKDAKVNTTFSDTGTGWLPFGQVLHAVGRMFFS